MDAYWHAKDEFEHDIKELFHGYISPEEFEKKWRPHLSKEAQDSLNLTKILPSEFRIKIKEET